MYWICLLWFNSKISYRTPSLWYDIWQPDDDCFVQSNRSQKLVQVSLFVKSPKEIKEYLVWLVYLLFWLITYPSINWKNILRHVFNEFNDFTVVHVSSAFQCCYWRHPWNTSSNSARTREDHIHSGIKCGHYLWFISAKRSFTFCWLKWMSRTLDLLTDQ